MTTSKIVLSYARKEIAKLYRLDPDPIASDFLAYKKTKNKNNNTTTVKTFQFERGVPVFFSYQPMTQLLDGALYQKIRCALNGLCLNGRKKKNIVHIKLTWALV